MKSQNEYLWLLVNYVSKLGYKIKVSTYFAVKFKFVVSDKYGYVVAYSDYLHNTEDDALIACFKYLIRNKL